MDKLIVKGPAKLSGEVKISSSKNACLPIMSAVLMTDQTITIDCLPNLRDVRTMNRVLQEMGVSVDQIGSKTNYSTPNLTSFEAPYDLVRTMRASILVLGPLLARFKKAKVSLPGGCAIGARPIDIHLKGLEKMGAIISIKSGYVEAQTAGLKGASIVLPFPSVGATENLMMAAVLADGETIIENAAKEPEIVDLARFLKNLGAQIQGEGGAVIKIQGVKQLHGTQYQVIGDRIEAATYIIAGVMTNSEITVSGFNPSDIDSVLQTLKDMGANIDKLENAVKVNRHKGLKGINVETAPYPGFPTDSQAQLVALASIVGSPSVITEKIFENRFMHIPELGRMGAEITLKGNTAFIPGSKQLKGAPVMCTDLRASAALILAALVAEGETEILRVYHLDRGYDLIDEKLSSLGVEVKRVSE